MDTILYLGALECAAGKQLKMKSIRTWSEASVCVVVTYCVQLASLMLTLTLCCAIHRQSAGGYKT